MSHFDEMLARRKNLEIIRQMMLRSEPVPLWKRMCIAIGDKGRKMLKTLERFVAR